MARRKTRGGQKKPQRSGLLKELKAKPPTEIAYHFWGTEEWILLFKLFEK